MGSIVFVRPPVLSAIADWGAENPTVLSLPFVSDIVRGELGESLTEPFDRQDFREVAFEIRTGETTYDIADNLVAAGLIRERRAFVFQSIERGVTTDFIAGRYSLTRAMTVDQIIDAMTIQASASPTIRVTFREGLRIEQMVAKLELMEISPTDPSKVLRLDVQAYYEMAMNPPADLVAEYSWLKLPQGASLEGFLFPAHVRHRGGHHAATVAREAAARLRRERPGASCWPCRPTRYTGPFRSPRWSSWRRRSTPTGRWWRASSPTASTRSAGRPGTSTRTRLSTTPTTRSGWPSNPIASWVNYVILGADRGVRRRTPNSTSRPG